MPDRLRPALGLTAIAVALLLLAGCGGGGKSATSSMASTHGPPATKAQFIAQAGRICLGLAAQEKQLRARQEALKGISGQSGDTAFVAIVRELVADSGAAESKIRALRKPAGDAHAIEQLLNALSEEAKDASSIAKAANTQETALAEVAEKYLRASVAGNSALAARFGMSDCIGSE